MTDASPITELKPCPFCGGEASLSDAKAGKDGLSRFARNPRCRRCGADHGYYQDAQSARAGWNRRAPLPEIEALVKAAERCERTINALDSVMPERKFEQYEKYKVEFSGDAIAELRAVRKDLRAVLQSYREKVK